MRPSSSNMSAVRRFLGISAFTSILAMAPTAVGQTGPSGADRATAQELFDQGRTLMQAGRYPEACAKFEQSQRIDPGGGTLLNLAVCHEKQGRLATAWGELHDALSFARRDGRKDREALASERIQAIAPNLPRLAMHVPAAAAPGVEVRIDGVPLAREAWDVATPVDPGPHEIVVGRPGLPTWNRSVVLREGETQDITVDNVDTSTPPAVIISPAPAPAQEGAPEPPKSVWADVPVEPMPHGKRSTAFYVVGGIGLASLATSAVTGIMALSLHSKSEETCVADRNYCVDPDGIDRANRARTFAWVSTGTLIGGATAIAVALLLPFRYDKKKAPAASLQVSPLPNAGAQMSLHASF
ncbi:hypothetical protein LVJ94_27650 [Pendulispora rubella]|uniref:Tetratricopeptide repeat protein n=1 Tax=Pendulispora rubella TaxID=2741070 RepID=A0ABZ2KWL6_9BACT